MRINKLALDQYFAKNEQAYVWGYRAGLKVKIPPGSYARRFLEEQIAMKDNWLGKCRVRRANAWYAGFLAALLKLQRDTGAA